MILVFTMLQVLEFKLYAQLCCELSCTQGLFEVFKLQVEGFGVPGIMFSFVAPLMVVVKYVRLAFFASLLP